MSSTTTIRRLTPPAIRSRKGGEPLICLTAYTAPVAQCVDAHADLMLVGDSLGMVLYGFDSTLPVTLEMMIAHGAAVVRASQRACVAIDMPFASYEASVEQAYRNAARVLAETGAQAVKLEGGVLMAETIAFLTGRGIPVIGHVGLTPQSVNALGGYRALGREDESAQRIKEDAQAVAAAGAFAVVLEAVMEPLGRSVTEAVDIPVIGIGASPACDGQILVTEDMTGMTRGHVPRFVKRFSALADDLDTAIASYAEDVRTRRFPAAEHCYGVGRAKTPLDSAPAAGGPGTGAAASDPASQTS